MTVNDYNNRIVELELSKYLTNNELNRIKRIINFFEITNQKEIQDICFEKGIPIEYISMLKDGTVVPDEKVLNILGI